MPRRTEYSIQRTVRPHSRFLHYVIIPVIMAAIVLISLGFYTFSNANSIMRQEPKRLSDFANNILPVYSVASFPSLDGVTGLDGWFFSSKTPPVSTVVFVHSQGANRLQFDVDTAVLYDFFVNRGYNVLSFDLRHSGNSKGNLSTFGYGEWADVIAAISYVRKVSTTKNVLLFGFGSGVNACILAMENIPLAMGTSGTGDSIKGTKIDFSRSYISGLILDTPSLSSDDYVQEVCRSSVFLGKEIGQYTIPFAVRLSAGAGRVTNLAAVISRTQLPVHLIYKKASDSSDDDRTTAFVTERQRLFPMMTTTYAIPHGSSLSTFTTDKQAYLDSIDDYLTRFIG